MSFDSFHLWDPQKPDLDLHVIHLVRDPRAVANSVLKMDGWIDMYTPSTMCNNIRESLRSVREFNNSRLLEQRYTLVRYQPSGMITESAAVGVGVGMAAGAGSRSRVGSRGRESESGWQLGPGVGVGTAAGAGSRSRDGSWVASLKRGNCLYCFYCSMY